ncbi:MAG: TIGR01777 family oxidoreductase [Trebonia sp.]
MGLTYSSVVRAEPDEVFAWHSRVGAITRLMPPWQPARVAWEAPSVRDGQAVLVLPGGLRWVAGHDPAAYDPPRQFADVLLPPLGMALHWRHTHSFTPAAGGTTVTDVVATPVPSRLLRPMFEYRHRQLAADLAAHARARELCPQPLTVALTGASGLIGSSLAALLTTGGHRAIRLVRRPPRHADEREWRPEAPDPDLLAGVDAVVHLAGASIGRRFTAASKREMLASRTGPTRALATLAAGLPDGPRVFVSASAVGFYGADRGDEVLTEDSERGEGFLADVAAAWEDAVRPATAAGIRTVQVRTGIVQTPRGGMLRLLYPLFEAGLGGPLGDGTGWQPWIEIDDLLYIYLRAVTDPALAGPVNAVAPAGVRNAEYASTLGRVLRRPTLIPVPPAGPRLLLGAEGARELAAASQRVRPAVLASSGHLFGYPDLEGALRHVLGRTAPTAGPRSTPSWESRGHQHRSLHP